MKPTLVLALLASLAFAACSGEAPAHDHASPGAAGGTEHEHSRVDRVALGDVKIGDHTLSVFQVTKLEPGKEGDFDLEVAAGKPLPGTVRGWIGIESGQGSMKVRFDKETDTRMHGHPEVPNPIPAGSLLWIEVEGAAGTSRASLAFKP